MGKIDEIYQALIKVFVRSNKRFPAGQELNDLVSQARQVLDGAVTHNLDQAKGKNLDDIDVMEKTMEKNADQLIDDYLSNEANKGRMTSEPTFTVVDQKKLPRAEIEALPLADKDKAAAAVKKKLEAQNEQARQSKEGGESGGGQRGAPELVDERFGQTLYIDSSEMNMIMDDAQRKFDQASDAVARGDYDEARAILRFEIEDNYKLPQATRDAAYDARVFIRRGEGINPKEMGYETMEETIEALNEQIAKGVQTTYKDNWPLYTAPDDASNMKSIEYVDFLDEAGEDFGTPNSQMITPADMDYEYAEGGRVGMAAGGIMRLLNKLVKAKKIGADRASDLVDLIAQAKKAGIPIKTMNDLENFEKQIGEASGKIYESRKKYPGVPEEEKSGLPVILKGKAPKTNLKKVRDKVKADKKNIQELADKNQIPVKDVSFSFADERKRLEELIQKLQTPMLRNDAIDRLKILNFVEDVGGDKAMYDKLRMKKYENLPPKSAYRSDPIAAEEDAERMMSKTQREIDMLTDPDKTVGRKDNADGGLNYLLGF